MAVPSPSLSPQTDWTAASRNESFFELFCSIGRQAFDVHRDKCTVTLASSTPQRWAVHAVVHRECGPKPCCGEGFGGTRVWGGSGGSTRARSGSAFLGLPFLMGVGEAQQMSFGHQ